VRTGRLVRRSLVYVLAVAGALWAVLLAQGVSEVRGGVEDRAAYVRCTDPPWPDEDEDDDGDAQNQAALDDVFGAANWDLFTFESGDTTPFTSGGYQVAFMEGSDNCAIEMADYIADNNAVIEAFVTAGGSLWQNSAPNEGVDFTLSFGATLDYDGGVDENVNVTWLDTAHPIFNGSFQPVAVDMTGDAYAHATIAGDSGTELQRGDDTAAPVLTEKREGAGLILYGGQTTTNFHDPQPEARNLRRNILEYLALAADAVPCAGQTATLVGTSGKDKLVGTPDKDVITGLGGKDNIKGLGGKDRLCGKGGKDKLKGGGGKDRLKGGSKADKLNGGGGRDKCAGGGGDDSASKCEVEKSI
jgi:Ca2+-binding RTX toxin-like protein